MKQKYRHTFRCPDCAYVFKKISINPDPKDAACPRCRKKEAYYRPAIGDGAVSEGKVGYVPEAPVIKVDYYHCNSCEKRIKFIKDCDDDRLSHCQHCGSQNIKYVEPYLLGNTASIAPGNQTMIKAVDIVASDTMKTYGMTDLNMSSSMKSGDTCAPKLPPQQQQMADNFFSPGKNPSIRGVNYNAIGKRAIAGAYRDPNNPVALAHRAKLRPGTEGKFVDATPGRR